MRHNPLAQILDRRMEDRRHEERMGQLDRRAKVPHFRNADIRRTLRLIHGDK